MNNSKECVIIPAVRSDAEFESALQYETEFIFDLDPDILNLSERVRFAHRAGKKLFIHLDLAGGIGKDKSGIEYAKRVGVDGIISTRVNIIKLAREQKLFTVQRFFIVDSHSVETTIDAAKSARPDMIEIMPGVVPKIIKTIESELDMPLIAGGLIETADEIEAVHNAGAYGISTGKQELWRIGV